MEQEGKQEMNEVLIELKGSLGFFRAAVKSTVRASSAV